MVEIDKTKAIIIGGAIIGIGVVAYLIYTGKINQVVGSTGSTTSGCTTCTGSSTSYYTVTVINNCAPLTYSALDANVVYTDPNGNQHNVTLSIGHKAVLQVKANSVLSIYTWPAIGGSPLGTLSTQKTITSNGTIYVCENIGHWKPGTLP